MAQIYSEQFQVKSNVQTSKPLNSHPILGFFFSLKVSCANYLQEHAYENHGLELRNLFKKGAGEVKMKGESAFLVGWL